MRQKRNSRKRGRNFIRLVSAPQYMEEEDILDQELARRLDISKGALSLRLSRHREKDMFYIAIDTKGNIAAVSVGKTRKVK